jgi:hypothetical protein
MNNELERICQEIVVSKLRYHSNICKSNWEKPPKTSVCEQWILNNELEQICKETVVSKFRYHSNICKSNWEKPPKTSMCEQRILNNELEEICKQIVESKLRCHFNISSSIWEKPPVCWAKFGESSWESQNFTVWGNTPTDWHNRMKWNLCCSGRHGLYSTHVKHQILCP